MKHLGDITKINGTTAPAVEIITGGSPCQDLSVAGKRAGLAGERSGLFMEQIRIIKEMRDHDRADGRTDINIRPRYMVWENVAGAFSSNNGEDFRAVLEETVRVIDKNACVPSIRNRKWPHAGCIMGTVDGTAYSVAWRLHDAQFWGVPQRRKRIALVADFAGESAAEILFERESVSRDTEPCGKEGQEVAGAVEDGIRKTGEYADAYTLKIRGGVEIDSAGKKAGKGALIQTELSGTLGVSQDQTLICREPAICLNDQGGSQMDVSEEITGTLRAQTHGHEPIVFEPGAVIALTTGMTPNIDENEVDFSLLSRDYKDMQCVAYRGDAITSPTNASNPQPGDACHTLSTDGRNYVVYDGNRRHDYKPFDEVCETIQAHYGTGGGNCPIVHDIDSYVVRRLTPLECERLQGFPDGWTDIGDWIDSKGKKHKGDSDTPRYKALGNSLALPFWEWMAKRMAEFLPEGATMASLFDGIGGFPLVFSRAGITPVWASEIEEFPIAVTKIRFPEREEETE